MPHDYIPRPDGDFTAWANNYNEAVHKFWEAQGLDLNDLKPLEQAIADWNKDYAAHVSAQAKAEAAADALAAAIKDEACDLVLTGLQSDDQGFAQVGVILAERLGMAHSTIIMEVQIDGTTLKVKRELEGGWFQWISMPLPAVLTIQSGINQLRYATLKGIMAAKKKDVRVVPAPAAAAARQRIVSIYVPEKTKATRLIEGSPADAAAELVRVLRDDARVF